jgi:GTP-binding protein HflX
LIESFQATLEEAADADAILEVIDASDPDAASQMAVVESLLTQLGAAALPRFFVFNKMDLLPGEPMATDPDQIDLEPAGLSAELTASLPTGQRQQAFFLSALTGEGLDGLVQAIADFSAATQLSTDLLLPYREAGLLDYVRSNGHLDKVEYLAEGILATIHIRYSHFRPLQPFVVPAKPDTPAPV